MDGLRGSFLLWPFVQSMSVSIDDAPTLPGTVLGIRVHTVNKTEQAKLLRGHSLAAASWESPRMAASESDHRTLHEPQRQGSCPPVTPRACSEREQMPETGAATLPHRECSPCRSPAVHGAWRRGSVFLSIRAQRVWLPLGMGGVSLSVGLNEEVRRLERYPKVLRN